MKTILPKILLSLLFVIIVVGSIWFFSQNAESNKASTNQNTESKELAKQPETSQKTPETSPVVADPAPTANSAPTSAPTITPDPTPAPAPTPAPVNSCIITISGKKYGISELIKTHSGGNVFKCGQDNTSIFFSKHNQAWLDSRMAKYKIN